MATIDDKVVAMSFESSKFESGVSKSISSLDKLKAALKFPHAGKAITEIGAASKAVDLGHIAKGVEGVKSALSTMRLTGIAVFAQLATQAIATGAAIVKAFTIEPMKAGFAEYSTNLNAVQTILANTQASGATLKDVNKALDELNTYSDKTIYNFSQMARNIGTFTAAGVDLKTATASIKGIANLAALSGSNAEQASTAMYQLSQAISSGSVKLMDWNSVVNAGMGGTVFQRALAQTAEHMGRLKEGTVQLVGPMKNVKIAGESFRNSLSAPGKDGWLSSGVLTETLKMFTSDMTDAELAAKGWNAAEIKAIQAQAKTAMLAATNVKTLQQVLQVAKETAGSGWAKTWQIVFGDFGEAKKTFTELSNAINSVIIDNARARNNLLADWKALGGRTLLIDSIKVAFHNLGLAIKPIKEAFRDIFPPITGKNLMALTVQFAHFAEALKPGKETIDNLKRTFKGLFSVLDIVKEVIFGVVGVIGDLLGAMGKGRGDFLSFTAGVGDALTKFHEWLIESGRLTAFFDKLGKVIKAPIQLLGSLLGVWKKLISGFVEGLGGFGDGVDGMSSSLSGFEKILALVGRAFNKLLDVLSHVGDLFAPVAESIGKGMREVGLAIGEAASNMNFDAILQVIRTGLLGGIFLMFKKFLGKGAGIDQLTKGFAGIGGGILQNISGSFKALQGNLVAMQQNIKAKTLKEIAIAVALLAASMVAMSLVNPERLKSSLAAMTVAFGELLGAMAVLTAVSKTAGFIKMPLIGASLILLAGAIDILSIAVIAMAQLSWGELVRGLAGVAGSLIILVRAVEPLSAGSAGLIRAGIGITALAIGLRIMASAVTAMSQLNLKELAKGLGAVGISLAILVTATNKMPAGGMVGIGIGLMAVAIALRIMADAVKAFGALDMKTMGKGLLGVFGALTAIGLAIKLYPPAYMIATGVGLIAVGYALGLIAKAVESMGGMSMREIAKGLITLSISLSLLGAAMTEMSGAVLGAVALGIMTAALAVLVPVLIKLGNQNWTTIIKSLIFLAAGIALLAGAAVLLSEALPFMIGLGVALVLIGGGIALAGAGLFLLSAGLSALIVALPTGVGILIAAITELQEAIPRIVKNTILGLLEIVNMLAEVAPKFVAAIVDIVTQLVNVVIKVAPKLGVAFEALLDVALKVIRDKAPDIIQAGLTLVLNLIQGLKNNIGQLVAAVVSLIGTFLRTIAGKIGDIVKAGLSILLGIIKGVVGGYAYIITTVLTIITKFISTITSNLGRIATAGLSILTKLLGAIAGALGKVITAGVDLIVAFVKGIGSAANRIVTAAREAAGSFINTLANQMVKLADQVFTAMITLISGLATVITNRAPELRTAGLQLGYAIIDGMTGGLLSKARGLYTSISGIMGKAKSLMHLPWKSKSPSQVMIDLGENIMAGMTIGMDKNAKGVYGSATAISNGVINSFKSTLQVASPSKVMIEIGKAVGQGFAQGIRGSSDDIKQAFTEMDEKLVAQMTSSRETIASEQEKLNELNAKLRQSRADMAKTDAKEGDKIKKLKEDQKEYLQEIKKVQATIDENENLLARSTAGHRVLVKTLKEEKSELSALANEFDKVTKELEEANDKLKEAIDTREQARKAFEDQYQKKPDVSDTMEDEIKSGREAIAQEQAKYDALITAKEQDAQKIADATAAITAAQVKFDELVAGKVLTSDGTKVDQLATYLQDLNTQVKNVSAYNATLEQLRKLGIDDATYKKLVEEGPEDQRFANQLLAGGKTAVTSLNVLDRQLKTVSETLAKNASQNLYQAGVDSAQGLVNSLEDSKSKIRKKMEEIAKLMLKTLRKSLGMKSPSKEFEEIGSLSMEGMAIGFATGTKIVTKAVDQAAKDALSAMKRSISDISSAVANELNPQPIITPILDLTQVRAQAGELGALTAVTPITAAASYGQATAISSAQQAAQAEELTVAPGGTSVKFEQNNYSPEALSDIEIYRQTKNQLSQLKSVLAIT